jgi:hypothetical protein
MTQEAAMDGNRFDDATKALIGRVGTRRAALTAGLALSGALRSLAAPPAVGARRRALKLAYRCSGTANQALTQGNGGRFAQVFTASRSGTLRKMQIPIVKTPNSPGDYIMQLVRVVNGVPLESPVAVLAAVTIPNASVPDGNSMLTGNFVGTHLVKETEYAAVVSRLLAGQGGLQVPLIVGTGNACAGTFAQGLDAVPFIVSPTFDLGISVFVA